MTDPRSPDYWVAIEEALALITSHAVGAAANEMADRILDRWDLDLDDIYPGASEDDAIGGAIWDRTIAILQPKMSDTPPPIDCECCRNNADDPEHHHSEYCYPGKKD